MKKLWIIIVTVLCGTLASLAQVPDSTSRSIDDTTSGYSSAGAIGLIILIIVVVAVIIAFTWRKKAE